MYKETGVRSFIKVITWRFLATVTTVLLVYIFVGKLEIAATVGALEVVIKMILYYLHERGWDKVKAGRYEARPFVLWFTGLPCAGKTTLGDKIYEFLVKKGHRVERLDGHAIRSLFPQTGFGREERNVHIRRLGFLASMLEKNGISVVASFVSPYKESREFIREICNNYIEVHVSTPVEVCEQRDTRDLYQRARAGKINYFTGVSAPYEVPERPALVIDAANQSVDGAVREIKKHVRKYL